MKNPAIQTLLLAFLAFQLVSHRLVGQEVIPITPPPVVKAHLTFSADQKLDIRSADGHFSPVELASGQTVLVNATFPAVMAGQAITIETPDGGIATVPEDWPKNVSAEGLFSFYYTSGSSAGTYRVALVNAGERWAMSFLTPNPNIPEGNSIALQPEAAATPSATPVQE